MPCFTPGIAIATPEGERAVEDLRPGDRVVTRDHGIQEVRWTGRRVLSRADLEAAPQLNPVLIGKGSLGGGLPERDMVVSPHHRLLVTGDRDMHFYETHQALIAARHLVNRKTIRDVEPLGAAYVHVMCARHELVLANGCWAECFQPSDVSLNGLGNAQRGEIEALFPELAAARRLLSVPPSQPLERPGRH